MMQRSKDKIVDALNAPNLQAIEAHEERRATALPWWALLVEAQKAMARVTKDSRVAFGQQRYAYTSAEDMIGACREALLSAGLALYREWTIEHSEAGSFVLSNFFLCCASGNYAVGMRLPFPIVSVNGKGEDKAVATALTSSLGYFLRDLLMVPKEDDAQQTVRAPEMDARDDRTVAAKPAPVAKVLGVQGSLDLQRRIKATGKGFDALLQAMRKAGVKEPPANLEQWPIALMPRIDLWLAANTPAASSAATEESVAAQS